MPGSPGLGRPRKENCKFKSSRRYKLRPCFKERARGWGIQEVEEGRGGLWDEAEGPRMFCWCWMAAVREPPRRYRIWENKQQANKQTNKREKGILQMTRSSTLGDVDRGRTGGAQLHRSTYTGENTYTFPQRPGCSKSVFGLSCFPSAPVLFSDSHPA